jgi:hypothetical protein
MISAGTTRRQFLKQTAIAAVATTMSALRNPLWALPEMGVRAAGFTLRIELSGLWFLALVDRQIYALAIPPKKWPQPGSIDEHDMHHYPRLFIEKNSSPMECSAQSNRCSAQFDIKGSIEWPEQLQRKMTSQFKLPDGVTNFNLLGKHFDRDKLTKATRVPLSFADPCSVLAPVPFKYEAALGCELPPTSLASKLVYTVPLEGKDFLVRFDGGPGPISVDPGDVLTLKVKNTTPKYSRCADPDPENHVDVKYAKHFKSHYHFLKGLNLNKCYPVPIFDKSKHDLVISGLYTCMMGGGS